MSPGTTHACDIRMTRRAAIGALLDTTIEWYDFFAFAIAAVIVFRPQFFPTSSPASLAGLARDAPSAVEFCAQRGGDLRE